MEEAKDNMAGISHPPLPRGFLTADDLAKKYNLKRTKICYLIYSGKLPAKKVILEYEAVVKNKLRKVRKQVWLVKEYDFWTIKPKKKQEDNSFRLKINWKKYL